MFDLERSGMQRCASTGLQCMTRKVLFNVNVAWFLISHRLEVARAARDSGFTVHVVADVENESEREFLEGEGFRFHRVRVRRGGLSPLHDLAYFRELSAVVRAVQPDLLHNVTVKPVIYGTIAGRRLGVRGIVNSVSGLGYAFSGVNSRRFVAKAVKVAYRAALMREDVRVIFQNDDDARTLISAGVIKSHQMVLIRGSGVDLDAFACTCEPEGAPVVVLPARMLRDKGVVEFAAAAKDIGDKGYGVEFLLAGRVDPGNRSSLKEGELAELERNTGVRWLGHVRDMASLYRQSHVVCLPSYYGEGLPKSLLEACAAGRPIVTTNVPGCRDAVRDGENGVLVKPRDPEGLAAAIATLLDDPTLRRRMGLAGRRRAEREFDVRAIVRATMGVYEDIFRQEA